MTRLREYVKAKAPMWLFCVLYNAYCITSKSDIRCRQSRGLLRVKSGSEARYVSTRTRALTYLSGFDARSSYLANIYSLDLIDFEHGDLVLDCGANMGDLHHWFTTQSISINYIGFEPNPIDFECLTHNVKNQTLINKGLWHENSSLDFYVSTEVASSSFIAPPFFSDVIQIATVRLDSLDFSSRIKLLKLEAEGAEPEVLLGAQNIIENIKYVSADVGPERGPHELSTRDAVVDLLVKWNFEIVRENDGHRHTILMRNKSF
jgi:FkbM family methyltransferase